MAFLGALPAIATALGGAASLARAVGPQGSGYQAQGVPLIQGATAQQASDTYKANQDALAQQQAFVNQLGAQGGLQNQSNVFGQQQALADQLQQATQGGGPNPALNQLAQSTGANVANQAALMASQRGAGANAGLLARQAAQQGGSLQQQAAGEAATLAAQQQIAARQQLAQQQAAMAGLATQQVGQQQAGVQNLTTAQQNEQQNILNSIAQQNAAATGQQAQINAANQRSAQQNAQTGAGLMSSIGSIITPATQFLTNAFSSPPSIQTQPNIASNVAVGGQSDVQPFSMAFKGGQVVGPRSQAGQHLYASRGGKVPGYAKGGDSIKNDTVPAMLSPGEIVIPRSIAQSDNAAEKAAQFVAAIKAKHRLK